MGTVYLIHFDKPFRHAKHYIGYTDDLETRIERHARGDGSRLIKAVVEADIGWRVARLWQGDRNLERRLKRWNNGGRLCPICKANKRQKP